MVLYFPDQTSTYSRDPLNQVDNLMRKWENLTVKYAGFSQLCLVSVI